MLYFDHNATTPVDPRVADVLDRAQRKYFANASSVHLAGQSARSELEQARRSIARMLGANASELIFTSGGTEANNLAVQGLLHPGMHAITSVIEHPSVLEPFRRLERAGVQVTYLSVGSNGLVRPSDLEEALRPNTALLSIMVANNETGAVQPISEMVEVLRVHNSNGGGARFHCDGVQAVGKLPLDLHSLGVDLLSLSGHKLYANKGIGALYASKGVKLNSLHFGGRQEHGMRAGTENVAGAMALACALQLCSQDEHRRLATIRDAFENQLLKEIPDARVIAREVSRLPNTSDVLFPEVSGEALLIALDMRGICVSTGSACSSGSIEPSHVLLEMGLTPAEARSCIRFSFGRSNSANEVHELVCAVSTCVNRIRERQLV